MNSILKHVLGYILLFAVFAGLIVYLFPAPCKQLVEYSVGSVDEKFRLSREKFLESIMQAEEGWEQASGRDLFVYNPDAALAINLLYDDRQQKTDRAATIKNSLEQYEQAGKSLHEQYDILYAQYVKAEQVYKQHVAEYDARLKQLNTDIAASNNAGGASGKEYRELKNREQALSAEYDALEQERKNLNLLAGQVNKVASAENKVVKTYNDEAATLNEEFGSDHEFGQGEYTGKEINIYEFTDARDLRTVLEHELGHALGLGHTTDPTSIMYYLAQEKNRAVSKPGAADLAALEAQCTKSSFDVFLERLRIAYTELVLR